MYKYYISLLFKSGITVDGYFPSDLSTVNDVFNKLMHVGETHSLNVFEAIFTNEEELFYFNIYDLSGMFVGNNPREDDIN